MPKPEYVPPKEVPIPDVLNIDVPPEPSGPMIEARNRLAQELLEVMQVQDPSTVQQRLPQYPQTPGYNRVMVQPSMMFGTAEYNMVRGFANDSVRQAQQQYENEVGRYHALVDQMMMPYSMMGAASTSFSQFNQRTPEEIKQAALQDQAFNIGLAKWNLHQSMANAESEFGNRISEIDYRAQKAEEEAKNRWNTFYDSSVGAVIQARPGETKVMYPEGLGEAKASQAAAEALGDQRKDALNKAVANHSTAIGATQAGVPKVAPTGEEDNPRYKVLQALASDTYGSLANYYWGANPDGQIRALQQRVLFGEAPNSFYDRVKADPTALKMLEELFEYSEGRYFSALSEGLVQASVAGVSQLTKEDGNPLTLRDDPKQWIASLMRRKQADDRAKKAEEKARAKEAWDAINPVPPQNVIGQYMY